MSGPADMRIDSKGKYYTKIVSTQQLEVLMRLNSGEMLQGMVHIRPNRRLSDEMNDEHPFISVTSAVLTQNGNELYRTAFVAINRGLIEWVIPVQAIGQGDDHLDESTEGEYSDERPNP
jgi:hypothetical protein